MGYLLAVFRGSVALEEPNEAEILAGLEQQIALDFVQANRGDAADS